MSTETDDFPYVVDTPVPGLSQSYREFDVHHGQPGYKAWETWLKAHNIPHMQVPLKGWAVRDTVRNTVSVLAFWFDPADDLIAAKSMILYTDKTDDGTPSGSKDVRYAVLTIQMESTPLPFPDVA